MNSRQKARLILKEIGGKENVVSVTHCMTRLRLQLKNEQEISEAALKDAGVLGLVKQEDQIQIIIGMQVGEVFDELEKLLQDTARASGKRKAGDWKEVCGGFRNSMGTVASVFNPMAPFLAMAGLIRGVWVLAAVVGIGKEHVLMQFVQHISVNIYQVIPFWVVFIIAKKVQADELQALMLMMLLYLGGPAGQGYILAPAAVVLLMICLQKGIRKICPHLNGSVQEKAAVTILTAGIMLSAGCQAAGYLESGIIYIVRFFFQKGGWAAGIVYGGLYSSMVSVGIHHAVLPVIIVELAEDGFTFLSPVSGAANMAQAGVAFAAFVRGIKNVDGKMLLTSLKGITEPVVYQVNRTYGKTVKISALGGACGGAFISALHLKAYAAGAPSFLNFWMFLSEDVRNCFAVIAGFLVAFLISFIGSCFFGFKEEKNDKG